jgi:aspartate-semialdehyde dehydrogenase
MGAKVAIIANEDSLLLEALLEAWSDGVLVDSQFSLVSPSSSVGESVLYEGRPITFKDIANFDFKQVDCVIALVSSTVIEAYKDILLAVSCPILGFFHDLQSLNPALFDDKSNKESKCWGVLQPSIAVLEYVLEDVKCESIDATVLFPASFYGKQGVQELASQTTRLLNAQAFESQLFGQQMPFNYFPISANPLGAEIECQLAREALLGFPGVDTHIKGIQMPVFYGLSLLVSVILEEEADIAGLKSIWQAKELISYQDSTKQLSIMEVANQNGAIILGDLKKSEVDNYRVDFWLGVDDVKFSAAHSLISAAEFLLKHHL